MTGTRAPLHQVWLAAAAHILRTDLIPEYPPKTVVSYGFPTGRDADDTKGACYDGERMHSVILIHPAEWDDPRSVLRTLVHEAIHATLQYKGIDDGHGVRFQEYAGIVGLETDENGVYSVPNAALGRWITETLEVLPPMPEDPLGRSGKVPKPPQRGRNHVHGCTCGIRVRLGRQDFDATCNLCNSPFTHLADSCGGCGTTNGTRKGK